MARTRSKHGSNRCVIHLSDENLIAVHAALTEPGHSKPGHGVLSQFMNRLLDGWRAERARQSDVATSGVQQ